MEQRLTEQHLAEPVTSHMRTDYAAIRPGQTAGEALASIRQNKPGGRIVYFYVVGEDGRLCGVVPTRNLLLADPDAPIASIMVTNVVSIPASATVLDAVEFFSLHRFLAFPIVGEGRRLCGVIDVELYTDELAELTESGNADDDLFQIIGLYADRARKADPVQAFRGRFPWLLCNVAGGVLAALLSGIYQEELGWQQAVLALFIPVVLALAESVSIQSVTLALEGMHGGRRPTWRGFLAKLAPEAITGVMLGVGVGVLVAAAAWLWQGLAVLAVCLLGGIAFGVTSAALLGMAIPNLFHLLERNPRVASGPIALAATDMVTLLAYFNLARVLT